MARQDEPTRAGEGAGRRLAEDASGLLREEMHRLREELATELHKAGTSGALVVAGGLLGMLALHAGSLALLRSLEALLPPRRAAYVLAAGYLAAGSTLAGVGIARLRQAGVVSQHAVSQVGRDLTSQ